MRNKEISSKLTKFKNFWNKKCIDDRKRQPVKPKAKILIFKRVNNPENKYLMKQVTKHMSPEKAVLFKQLFRKFVD